MPGVGLIRSKPRPSRWLSPKSKQSFTKRRLLITASSKSFSARCANSVSKSSSDRHRESANAPAASIPKVLYFSAIPLKALAHIGRSDGQVNPSGWSQSEHGLKCLQHFNHSTQGGWNKFPPHLDPPTP